MIVLCGYLLWGLIFLAIAALIAATLGKVTSILLRKKEKTKIPRLVTIGACIMIFGALIYYFTSFNGYRGFGDWYRIPIQYPYQISIYGAQFDDGCLDRWKENNSTILCGITHYTTLNEVMAAKCEEQWKGSSGQCFAYDRDTHEHIDTGQWFTFNFDTEEIIYYPSEYEFLQACMGFGFKQEPELRSIREHLED